MTGELQPGLCRDWRADREGRRWTLECAHAAAIARRLRAGPFPVASTRVAGRRIVVRLSRPWRRFAYVLAGAAAAPLDVPGPFRLVTSSRGRTVVRRRGQTVVFRRMAPNAAVEAFRRGELDEAPAPQGEVRALEAELGAAVRVRRLLGVDLVVLSRGLPEEVRRAYWLTVPRAEYQGLISERFAPPAFGLLDSAPRTSPADVRAARASARELPRIPLRLAVPARPELVEAAELAWAEWRQLRLPAELYPGGRETNARFQRLVAPYPHTEALFTMLGEPPQSSLTRLDERLRRAALVVPLGHVAEARLVNPRLRGWGLDALGVVDYTRVYIEN